MSRRKLFFFTFVFFYIGIASIFWRNILTSPVSDLNITMSTKPPKKIIIVGSGLAGLSAASQVLSRGLRVHMLERASKPGGNSIKASSGINGAPTKYQPGLPFSDTFFYTDTLKSVGHAIETKRSERESLISTLVNGSAEAIDWLVVKGVDLSAVAQLGGHSFPRTHRGKGKTPPGASIVSTLLSELKADPLFTLETSCVVTKILHFLGVDGVEYICGNEVKMANGPVIFATGGFAGDAHGLLAQHRPELVGFPSTNEPAVGSQPLLTAIGAQLLDMDLVQVHPTSFVDPKDPNNPIKFLAAEMLRGEGGLLLFDGKRFVNELETRKKVTDAITTHWAEEMSPRQWDIQLVLDEGVYKKASSHIDFYVWKGLMQKTIIRSLGRCAFATIKAYAKAAAGGERDLFDRQYFGHWELSKVTEDTVVYVGRVTPAVHFTMGGVVINQKGQVLGKDDMQIEGLWAAGEVTGGLHGENRLAGSSLLECVVFGRIAGDQAASFIRASS